MHPQLLYDLARYRTEQKYAEAEQKRLVLLAAGRRPTLRARTARKLFEAAVALESEETWRIVWEKLQARRRL